VKHAAKKLFKHMPYYTVLEALKTAKGCALCELEAKAMHSYLDNLLYENVNDVGVRGDLARSRGYCPRHAHMLAGFQDGLGTAILYQDQVRLFLRFLSQLQGVMAKVLRKNAVAEWSLHDVCPACRIEMQTRQGHLSTLLEALSETDMRQAFSTSAGLCVQHFLAALQRADDPHLRQYLLAVEDKKLEDLLHDLEEFCRKHDYRFIKDGFGKEKDSWQRAINMMTGLKDVF
jgi:hypothetical protein